MKDFDSLPDYDQEKLLDAWDLITEEYGNDTGNNSQKIVLRKKMKEINNITRVELMENCRLLMHLNPKKAKEYLKKINFHCSNDVKSDILKLKNKILQTETTIRINRLKEVKKDKKEFKSDFYQILAIIHKNITYVDENVLTVKMMNQYLLSLKKVA